MALDPPFRFFGACVRVLETECYSCKETQTCLTLSLVGSPAKFWICADCALDDVPQYQVSRLKVRFSQCQSCIGEALLTYVLYDDGKNLGLCARCTAEIYEAFTPTPKPAKKSPK